MILCDTGPIFAAADRRDADHHACVELFTPSPSSSPQLTMANWASLVDGVDHEYHADLLELLGRDKAYERCDAAAMLQALGQAGVHPSELLACKELVGAYDAEVRDQLLASLLVGREVCPLVERPWRAPRWIYCKDLLESPLSSRCSWWPSRA